MADLLFVGTHATDDPTRAAPDMTRGTQAAGCRLTVETFIR